MQPIGPPVTNLIQPMPYTVFQGILDGFNPWGWHNSHRGLHLKGLTDEVVTSYVEGLVRSLRRSA